MIELIELRNNCGMELVVSNYGATIKSLKVLDNQNTSVNVAVGLEYEEDYITSEYQKQNLFLGSSIGRYAGRISGGKFTLDGIEYSLHNLNGVHLHGGKEGFDKKYWEIVSVKRGRTPFVTLSYRSEHMEEGYPGNLYVEVTYHLMESNALKIVYSARTDKTTIVNLTNHSYFNLNGYGTVLNHSLKINSDNFLEVDDSLLPTGVILPTKNTNYDRNIELELGKQKFEGFDDTFILNKKPKAASLWSRNTGIYMKVYTNQPAVVVYTPRRFPDFIFNQRTNYSEYPAICFETQNFPDAPNNHNFPNCKLLSGNNYKNETVFDFSIKSMV